MENQQKLYLRLSRNIGSELSDPQEEKQGDIVEGFSIDDRGLKGALTDLNDALKLFDDYKDDGMTLAVVLGEPKGENVGKDMFVPSMILISGNPGFFPTIEQAYDWIRERLMSDLSENDHVKNLMKANKI